MSKRLFVLIIVGVLLVLSSVAYAQEAPVRVITEAQITEAFTIPGTATRNISNLKVKVQADGVHLSFDMTVTRDGKSNTLNIIAILIGLQVNQLQVENPKVSGWQATASQQREVAGLVEGAWETYVTGVFGELPVDLPPAQGIIMSDGRICNPRWGC
jgi:hypothetical protein